MIFRGPHACRSTHVSFSLPPLGQVQKVRKTANEYYLVAAGLPNPFLLPTAKDRAVGIASFGFAMIMAINVLNIEFRKFGIEFQLQVSLGFAAPSSLANPLPFPRGHLLSHALLLLCIPNTKARRICLSHLLAPGRHRCELSTQAHQHGLRMSIAGGRPFRRRHRRRDRSQGLPV